MAKEKVKRKGYNRMTGERGLRGASKEAAERRAQTTAMRQKNFELAGKPKPKYSREFKKMAKRKMGTYWNGWFYIRRVWYK
jgi:hypothetical protein